MGLWEISLALALGGVMVAVVGLSAGRGLEAARARRTLRDMSAILEAARQYDAIHQSWPGSWPELHTMLARAPEHNVWGYPYVLGASAGLAWVETDMPAGIHGLLTQGDLMMITPSGSNSRVRLSTGRRYGIAGRLAYEHKELYAP